MDKSGILYGVGVGPGDPALLTLKAVEMLQSCDAVAAPAAKGDHSAALDIVSEYIEGKDVFFCHAPMSRDPAVLGAAYDASAHAICERLEQGQKVCFVTLGDPAVYSTYAYIHHRVKARGYRAEMIPGITSFSAAAAALGTPLCEGGEMLHIIPGSYCGVEMGLDLPGTRVLMKSGRQLPQIYELLEARGLLEKAQMGVRVTMEGEELHTALTAKPTGGAGYFSTIIIREAGRNE